MQTAWSIIEGSLAGFGAMVLALFMLGLTRNRRTKRNPSE